MRSFLLPAAAGILAAFGVNLFGAEPFLSSEVYRPVKVIRSSESFPSNIREYGAEKAIDGDPATYACFLDDYRNGENPNLMPPFAQPPVTSEFVVDLGGVRTLSGAGIQCRNLPGSFHPKSIDLFGYADDDPERAEKVTLLADQTLPPEGDSRIYSFRFDKPVTLRYLGVQVNDSYESGVNGSPHYNTQIAELLPFYGETFADKTPNAPETAYPEDRLRLDWAYQDAGVGTSGWFASNENADMPRRMVEKVLAELDEEDFDTASFRQEMDRLIAENCPASDSGWVSLYLNACRVRRTIRLGAMTEKAAQIIYAKHCVLSGPVHYAWNDELTDQQACERIVAFKPGAQLCRLTIHDDGSITNEVLLEQPNGMIRDPNMSFDAQTVVFSMRENYETDDFHLYLMNLADKSVQQITSEKAVSDTEPAFLPDGNIIFQSTRCTQLTDCWQQAVANLYRIHPDGTGLRRLGYDQVHTNYPQLLDDGRVIYTRWEYNDRGQIFPQPLFAMNPDGASQGAVYGENSWWPTSILHARGVPGTGKIVAVVSGHHTHQRGKLILIDRSRGTQSTQGIEFLAPRREADIPEPEDYRGEIDAFGQTGEQFQYPFALSEEEYLVTYSPEGWPMPGGG